MKTLKFFLLLLFVCMFTACSSDGLSINISNSDDNSSESSTTIDNSGESSTTTDSSDSDSQLTLVTISKLDISKSDDTIPADVEEMLVYGNINLYNQITYIFDVTELGMNDDEINDYGLWHDSMNRVFCGFEEQYSESIKGILTSPDGTQNFYNTSMEFNQLGNEEYCIGFNISGLSSGGPYEFSLDIPEFKVRDIFNVYVNTLIVGNWEPNESIRVITYSHEVHLSPTGNFHSESYLNADENGELWLEIVDTSSNSMWENDLIAILMHGESGKIAELFTEKNYSNIKENATNYQTQVNSNPEVVETEEESTPGEVVLVSFESDVLPILVSACMQCHGTSSIRVGLSVVSYYGLMEGSNNGAVIVAGDAEASKLIRLITSGTMPKTGASLTPEQIEIISAWIDQGALDN